MLIKKQHNNNNTKPKLNRLKKSLRKIKQSSTFIKNTIVLQKKIQLAITLSSKISQVKDIAYSIAAIEKLIYHINSVCAKQLRTALDLFCLNKTKSTIVSQKELTFLPTSTQFIKLHNYTNLLAYQKIFKKKQQCNYEVINNKDNNNTKSNTKILLERSYYSNRWFFKLSKEFSTQSAVNKQLVQRKNSKRLFTVIRAPFVFKKTREQFCSQKLSSHLVITFASSAQKNFLIQNLRLLKLPTELKLISRN
uniref:Ribosomal protein S10 n=1 Tax=Percursaria percursa TaxID=153906 RepID=A0A8K1JA94_9CHLO|nr:ribosomal protein S10 [Percursaria percursa]